MLMLNYLNTFTTYETTAYLYLYIYYILNELETRIKCFPVSSKLDHIWGKEMILENEISIQTVLVFII